MTAVTRRTRQAVRRSRSGAVVRGPSSVKPTRRLERELAADPTGVPRVVAAMDEVGRGCLAGPVSVGVVVSDLLRRAPSGLRDSKLLPSTRREELVRPIRSWALACAVGHAEAEEIDRIGIMAALALAGRRALAQIRATGLTPSIVLLDGNHDWLTRQTDLFAAFESSEGSSPAASSASSSYETAAPRVAETDDDESQPRVVVRIKADMTCTGVAAASILAKVERDALMREAHAGDPRFAWDENKGYASPAHIAALAEHGPTPLHRRSWRLPGTGAGDGMMVP
ncbi:ribonuclease HII [Salana multivorans]